MKNFKRKVSDRVIFLHVKKTAGTTLNSILSLQYVGRKTFWITPENNRKDFLELPQDERDRVYLLRGHVNFGCHTWFSNKSDYITILREPQKRVFSYLNYWMQDAIAHINNAAPWFRLIRENSPEDLLQNRMHYELENGMVRQLSGKGNAREPCTQNDLDMAMHNLEKKIVTFGLTEHFYDSLSLFRKSLGWRFPIAFSGQKVRKKDFFSYDERLEELIFENNSLDIQLYQFAEELFEQRCNHVGVSKASNRIKLENRILYPIVAAIKNVR